MSDIDNYKIAEELIEDIYKFKKDKCIDLGILEVIIEYSIYNGIPIQEIGNVLSDHSEYIRILENELINEKYIKNTKVDTLHEDEW